MVAVQGSRGFLRTGTVEQNIPKPKQTKACAASTDWN